MATMTAALHDGRGAMHVTEMPRPEAGPGDVIVRVRACGICGSDLLYYDGATERESRPGGHEVAGEIVEVGEGVDPARRGERVAIDIIGHGRACGSCWYCRLGQYALCQSHVPSEGGGFAQYIRRRVDGCYTLADSLSWEEGALVEPLAVSVHALRRGGFTAGETVAVLGAGNIGLTTVAAARAFGAGRILVSARHRHQGELAKHLGADDALPTDGSALQDALKNATQGRGADLTIETVGGKSEATFRQALEVTRPQGRAVILGNFQRTAVSFGALETSGRELSIIFSNCYSIIDGRHDFEVAADLLASGRAHIEEMVTHKFPLQEVQRGFETARDKSTGSVKVQIHM